MRTIRSVLRTLANYPMWRAMRACVMSVIPLSAGGWLTRAIWLVRYLLQYCHTNIMLVLSGLFVHHWCLLPCAPACGIHCPDRLLVPTGVFSTRKYAVFTHSNIKQKMRQSHRLPSPTQLKSQNECIASRGTVQVHHNSPVQIISLKYMIYISRKGNEKIVIYRNFKMMEGVFSGQNRDIYEVYHHVPGIV